MSLSVQRQARAPKHTDSLQSIQLLNPLVIITRKISKPQKRNRAEPLGKKKKGGMVDSCVIFLPNINQRNPKKGEKTVNKEPSNTNHKLGKTKLCFAAVLSFLNKMEPIITSNP